MKKTFTAVKELWTIIIEKSFMEKKKSIKKYLTFYAICHLQN